MATMTSLPLSDKVLAVAILNRLQRDLRELTNAARGVDVLHADEGGQVFDAACHLTGALNSLRSAIGALQTYAEVQ